MVRQVFVALGLVLLLAQVGICQEEYVAPSPTYPKDSRRQALPPRNPEARGDQPKQTRPGFVVPVNAQESDESLPSRYERPRPQRQVPGNQRPQNGPRPVAPVRRPLARPVRQPEAQAAAPSGFSNFQGSQVPQGGPKQASPVEPTLPSTDFKPFGEPSDELKEEGRRPVRAPQRPTENFSNGFPSGFADGLPNFSFQGRMPDTPAGDGRGFLEGFGSFPSFKAVGGFEPIRAGGNQRQDVVANDTPVRASNLKKRNPVDDNMNEEKFEAPENREERYYDDVKLTRVRRVPTAEKFASSLPVKSLSSVPEKSGRNSTKTGRTKFKHSELTTKLNQNSGSNNKTTNRSKNIKSSQVMGLKKNASRNTSAVTTDEVYMDEDVKDEFLLGDEFFKAGAISRAGASDNSAAEQRFFPRRNDNRNNRQGDFPSFENLRPFFDDFHGFKADRPTQHPSPPPRRPAPSPRPRPRPSNDQRFDGSDNSLLGSGNFLVLPGGTFKDSSDYHEYYVNNRYKPYRPEYNEDFFSNFRDFADINHKREYSSYRDEAVHPLQEDF